MHAAIVMQNAHSKAHSNACSNAHSNACSKARKNAALLKHTHACMCVMACFSAVKSVMSLATQES
eukprot:1160737-Pelagomonas_calceolata.AAC.3